jgi:hypothetical protein
MLRLQRTCVCVCVCVCPSACKEEPKTCANYPCNYSTVPTRCSRGSILLLLQYTCTCTSTFAGPTFHARLFHESSPKPEGCHESTISESRVHQEAIKSHQDESMAVKETSHLLEKTVAGRRARHSQPASQPAS